MYFAVVYVFAMNTFKKAFKFTCNSLNFIVNVDCVLNKILFFCFSVPYVVIINIGSTSLDSYACLSAICVFGALFYII